MINSFKERLLELKAISPQALAAAEKKAKELGTTLPEYLVEQKLVSDELVAKAFAEVLNVPFIDKINEAMVNTELLGKAPFRFLKENNIIPIKEQGKLVFVIADPFHFQAVDELRVLLGDPAHLSLATTKSINDAINRLYPLEGTKQMIEELGETGELEEEAVEFGEIDERNLLGMAQEAPVIKMVNHILFQAVKQSASDIHIEPLEKELQVRYRIDGVLHTAFNPPKRIQSALVSRVKIMSNLNIAEKRKPQDGRVQIKVADKSIDIRVSIIPTVFGEKVALRLLDKSHGVVALEKIGFSKRDLQVVLQSIGLPNGIIMVTGPTGSGKTTTLYAILNRLNTEDVSIVTVEDPVEYQISGIAQVQVNEKAGVTFASALRAFLRQDPDIMMVGETRDHETAQIAIQASLTGHLVLTTLHTNNAPASITRLLDMGVEPYLIASSVTCVIAQRLVRKLCPLCKKAYKPAPGLFKALGLSEAEASKITFYQAIGCPECSNTGYKGRLAVFEIMQMSPAVAKLTLARADANQLRIAAQQDGMTLLIQDGVEKIKQELTTIDEVLSAASTAQLME